MQSVARAVVFHGLEKPLEIVCLPLPDRLEQGEVLVEIVLATICGSDLHTLAGRRKEKTPSILGHEAVGRIVDAGTRNQELRVGRRVTWSLVDSCGGCPACTDWGLPQKCVQMFKYGHETLGTATGLHGCYATHIVLRPGTAILSVPDSLPDAAVAPANCALSTMVAALESLPVPCRSAWVQGCGLLGLYACALLKDRGVDTVFASDPNPVRRAQAAELGALALDSEEAETLIDQSIDLVVEVAGTPTVVPDGVRVLRPGGWYVFAGMALPGPSLALSGEQILRKCLTLRGSHNYAPRHLEEGLRFLERTQPIRKWDSWVSPPFALRECTQALELARSGKWPRVSIRPGG